MCTGFELFAAGATIFGAASSRKAGKDQERAANASAAQAEEDARAEKAAAAARAGVVRRRGKRDVSTARATYAGAGVDVSFGTPATVEGEIARSSEEDALNELLHGSRLGARYAQEAENLRTAGRLARSAANRDAAGSLLIGGAQLSSGWKTPNRPGTPILLATGGELA